jgi:hypothetical protein
MTLPSGTIVQALMCIRLSTHNDLLRRSNMFIEISTIEPYMLRRSIMLFSLNDAYLIAYWDEKHSSLLFVFHSLILFCEKHQQEPDRVESPSVYADTPSFAFGDCHPFPNRVRDRHFRGELEAGTIKPVKLFHKFLLFHFKKFIHERLHQRAYQQDSRNHHQVGHRPGSQPDLKERVNKSDVDGDERKRNNTGCDNAHDEGKCDLLFHRIAVRLLPCCSFG